MIEDRTIKRLTKLANEITFEKYHLLDTHFSECDVRFICELYEVDKLAREKLVKVKDLLCKEK